MKLNSQRVIFVTIAIFLFVFISIQFLDVNNLRWEIQNRWSSSNRSIKDCTGTERGWSDEFGARILLLAYMRSGSTYTSELLALDPQVNYMFEPLFIFRNARIDWDNAEEAASISNLMENLYQCDPLITSYVMSSKFVQRIRFEADSCKSRPLLIKTIRLHGKVVPQLMQNIPHLKVVHLIRDPRAIFSSRNKVMSKWEADEICRQIRADIKMINLMKLQNPDRWKDRYMLVRYEDLADKQRMNASLTEVYNFLKMTLNTSLLEKYNQQHYGSHKRRGSFNTVRDADFDPNHWQKTMSTHDINTIQNECGDILHRFGYTIFNTSTAAKYGTIRLKQKHTELGRKHD